MRGFQRRIEACLISAVERRKINCLERCVKLLLVLGSPCCVSSDDGSGKRSSMPKKRWTLDASAQIRSSVRCGEEFRLSFVSGNHSRRDQEFLAGLRIFGEQHWQNIVVAAAVPRIAPFEKTVMIRLCGLPNRRIQRHTRTLRSVSVDLFRNLYPSAEDAGSSPMLLIRIASARPRNILHRQHAPVGVVQPWVFRMRDVRVKSPLRFALTREEFQPVESSFCKGRVRRNFGQWKQRRTAQARS